jgi:polysaccharide biosynthesis transport protein
MSGVTPQITGGVNQLRGPQDPFAGGAPSSGGGGGLDAGDILRILKQRKLLIFVVFTLLFSLSIGATAFVYYTMREYEAEAFVEVIPPQPDPFAITDPLLAKEQMELLVQNQARQLTSIALLRDVLGRPQIKQTQFFQERGTVAEALVDLRQKLAVTPLRGERYIRVALALPSPDEAEEIVDTILATHKSASESESDDEIQARIQSIQQTLSGVNNDLEQKRSDIRTFRLESGFADIEAQRTQVAGQLVELEREITALDSERNDRTAQLNAIADRPLGELPVTPEMRIQANADPILRFRREQVESLQAQRQALLEAETLGPTHRTIRELDAQIAIFRNFETARREQLFDDIRSQQIEALEQTVARINGILAGLAEKQLSLRAEQRELDRRSVELEELEQDSQRLLSTLRGLDQRLAEAENAQRAATERGYLQYNPADAPPRPSFPNVPLFVAAGFVVSLIGGVGLAFVREFLDQGVRTPLDVARSAHVSVLGTVPELDDDESDIDAIEDAVRRAPQSLLAESFRQVRTNLTFSGPEETQRVLMITSPGAGDGKSAAAINLAATLAQSGLRVLLADANFRRPTVHTHFADTRAEGLSNILIGQGSLDDYATATDLPNLDVLTSGPLPPTPAELLGSPAMRRFLEAATTQYDRVLLDGPPVLLVSDAGVLASQVSGVILVSRAARNTKGALKRAVDTVQRVGGRVIGSILNGVEARPGGYFRKQYREFYDYTADEGYPAELPQTALPPEESREQSDDQR